MALKKQETDPHGRRLRQRRGRDDRPVDALVGGREDLQADGQWPRADAVGDDQWPQEIIPVKTHRHQRERGVDRPGQWNVYAPQDLQRAGTFDASRFVELPGHTHDILSQQHDRDC